MMTPGPSAHIWIAAGHTDMRRGMQGLSALVQTALAQNPFSGHVFVFRGRRGDLVKILWFDGDGLCLFLKKLERGRLRHQRHSGTLPGARSRPGSGVSSATGHAATFRGAESQATETGAGDGFGPSINVTRSEQWSNE